MTEDIRFQSVIEVFSRHVRVHSEQLYLRRFDKRPAFVSRTIHASIYNNGITTNRNEAGKA